MITYTTFQTNLHIHPDHVGFVIGSKGATVRRVGMLHSVDVRLKHNNSQNHLLSSNWPYIQIKGPMKKVESAYFEIQQIANVANQRIPRITQIPPTKEITPVSSPTKDTQHVEEHSSSNKAPLGDWGEE